MPPLTYASYLDLEELLSLQNRLVQLMSLQPAGTR